MDSQKPDIIGDAFRRHGEILTKVLEAGFLADVRAGADLFCDVIIKGGCVFTCGNGGSAADAQHLSAELLCRYNGDRMPLPAVVLTGDASAVTAIGNDYDFQEIFARQLRALGKSGDLLVAFTTSGVSKNVLKAIDVARQKSMHVIVLTGTKGELLRTQVDACIVVPCEETARIQEFHELAYHAWCEQLDAMLRSLQPSQNAGFSVV